MMETGDNNIVVQWGRAFTKARKGLDEEKVKSFVYDLLSECHLLTRQPEQIPIFSRLNGTDKSYSDWKDN